MVRSKFDNKPIQIYLDSSDYSRLSDPLRNSQWQVESVSLLKDAVSKGKVEIRFSAATVAEASPVDEQAAEASRLRLNLISGICGKKVLRSPTDIIREELLRGSAWGFPLQHAFDDNEGWIPRLHVGEKLKQLKQSALSMAERLPRERRRHFLAPGGKHFKRPLFDRSSQSFKGLISEFPVTNDAIPFIERYLLGKESLSSAERATLSGISSVQRISQMIGSNFVEAKKLFAWIRDGGARHLTRVNGMRSAVQTLTAALGGKGSVAQVEKVIAEEKMTLVNGGSDHIRRTYLGEDEFFGPIKTEEEFRLVLPTLYSFIEAASNVVRSEAVRLKFPAKPEESDVGDIHHSVYIPHVDIFRCDTKMKANFFPIGAAFSTRIEESLDAVLNVVRGLD